MLPFPWREASLAFHRERCSSLCVQEERLDSLRSRELLSRACRRRGREPVNDPRAATHAESKGPVDRVDAEKPPCVLPSSPWSAVRRTNFGSVPRP